jgi:hypothetical protein
MVERYGMRLASAILTASQNPAASTVGKDANPQQSAAEVPAQMFPIFDRGTRKKTMVDATRYEQEGVQLARTLRYLAKEIPADASVVLKQYPFGQVKEMYDDILDSLRLACEHYAKGELLEAGMWAREAAQYSGIEMKAHRIFQQESVFSYVGKRVGLAVIGFFQGAAESLLGLVDQGASLFGVKTGLVEWSAGRYDLIKDAYGGATGIDHTLVHDDEIGRFGGRVAGSLATGKAMAGGGTLGQAGMVVLGTASVKGAVQTVARLRAAGKSWGEILKDPMVIAELAGAVAGIAGMGGAAAPQQLRGFLNQVGLGASAVEISALTAKIVSVYADKTLGSEDRFNQLLDLFADVVVSGASTADQLSPKGAHAKEAPRHGEPQATSESSTPSRAGTSPDVPPIVQPGSHPQVPAEQRLLTAGEPIADGAPAAPTTEAEAVATPASPARVEEPATAPTAQETAGTQSAGDEASPASATEAVTVPGVSRVRAEEPGTAQAGPETVSARSIDDPITVVGFRRIGVNDGDAATTRRGALVRPPNVVEPVPRRSSAPRDQFEFRTPLGMPTHVVIRGVAVTSRLRSVLLGSINRHFRIDVYRILAKNPYHLLRDLRPADWEAGHARSHAGSRDANGVADADVLVVQLKESNQGQGRTHEGREGGYGEIKMDEFVNVDGIAMHARSAWDFLVVQKRRLTPAEFALLPRLPL